MQPYSEKLKREIEAALKAKGPGYKPRTRHFGPDGSPLFTNRLILEDSPYLLQHAHNPVDWYPWGPEAFEKAKRENKPIFLSIGYSTCHWCHVMEKESFEDLKIARYLNEHFVCIKVDREERPDIDTIYMTALMLLNRSGGWPMSSFLTPEGKTFYAGTYFPPEHFYGLLQQVNQAWQERKQQVLQQAEAVARALQEVLSARSSEHKIDQSLFTRCLKTLRDIHDNKFGGFGGAPKFPSESYYLFLADWYFRERCPSCLEILEKDLDIIGRSGLHDQAGGGFHRYSTDERWLVPHFEKMLYNQANMARVYTRAWSITQNPYFSWIAERTLFYVLREMRSPEGGFYSATDADSEGKEGLYFTWTPDQIDKALNREDAAFAKDFYEITPGGNFEGRNILHIGSPLEFYIKTGKTGLADLLDRLERINSGLLKARARRVPPLRDEKIITAWNGMMISALSEGYENFHKAAFKEGALKSAEYIWQTGFKNQKGLARVIFNGHPGTQGVLKDYACLAEGLVHLYDITHDEKWLERAEKLADEMVKRFWDVKHGAFFMTEQSGNSAPLIAVPKDGNDGATPSGNSVAVNLLAMLAARSGSSLYESRAKATLNAFSEEINQHPASFAYMLVGAAKILHGEGGPKQYGAKGKVMARACWAASDTIEIRLFIRKGYHINSHKPSAKDLIPTTLGLSQRSSGEWKLEKIDYPRPENTRTGHSRIGLSIFKGEPVFKVKVSPRTQNPVQGPEIDLSIQACSSKACLSPEVLKLRLGLPK